MKAKARRAQPAPPMEKVRLFDKPPGVRRLVEVKEACRYAHVSRSGLYRLLRKQRVRAYKDGARTMIDLNTVDAYLNSLPEIFLQ
jgi:excisionase family DNA binding protein